MDEELTLSANEAQGLWTLLLTITKRQEGEVFDGRPQELRDGYDNAIAKLITFCRQL